MPRGARGRRPRRAVKIRPRRRVQTSRNAIHCMRKDKQPHAAATESLGAGGTPVDDAIEKTHSFRDREPSISALSLPPAPKLRSEGHPVDEPPPPTSPPRLAHHVDKTAQRRRLPPRSGNRAAADRRAARHRHSHTDRFDSWVRRHRRADNDLSFPTRRPPTKTHKREHSNGSVHGQ